MSRNGSLALVLLALAAALFFILKRPHKAPNTVEVRPATAKTAPAKPVPEKTVDVPRKLVEGTTELGDIEQKIGLRQGHYTIDEDGSPSLEVQLVGAAACHVGDLDVIKGAIGKSNIPVIATMEPLSGKGRGVVSQKLSYDDLLNGISLKFKPNTSDLALYGLYVCTDSGMDEHCRGKKTANMSGFQSSKRQDEDQIFFFQTIVLDKERFMQFDNPYTGSKDLGKYLAARGNHGVDAGIAEAKKVGTALRSMPVSGIDRPDHNGTFLRVALPYLRTDRCRTGKIRTP